MPSAKILNWADTGTNGSSTVGSGEAAMDVTITTSTNGDGQTGAIESRGSPAAETLWVSGLSDAVTTTIEFDGPVENVKFELFDVDQNGTDWDERVTILATDAAGNIFPVSYSDLHTTHSASDGILDAFGMADSATNTGGAEDTVSVSIIGPITSLEIIFENGEDAAQTGDIGVGNISFVNASVGIVEGTAAADLIDETYVDDPEGDRVTDGDDVIHAGDGNDTVYAGDGDDVILGEDGNDVLIGEEGNDTLDGGDGDDYLLGGAGDNLFFGGAGSDTIETNEGNDTVFGGSGDDSINGHIGDDELHGGTGNDYLRGSIGNDTIYSGGTGEGDDFLWGGYNDDVFVIEDGFGNDTIEGEDIDEVDGDTIDMSAVTTGVTLDLTDSTPGRGSFTDGTDTTTFFDIEHIVLSAGQDTILLSDGSGQDSVTGFTLPSENSDGSYTAGDLLDVSALIWHDEELPITTKNVSVSADSDGNAVLTFPSGAALTLVGVSAADVSDAAVLEAMGIPAAPDGYVTGTEGDDTLNINEADTDGDVIDGDDATLPGMSGDDDHIRALGGDDRVFAGEGDDIIEGGAGNDSIYARLGNDTLYGGSGADELQGDEGDDVFYGGDAADLLNGGDGSDTFRDITDGDTIWGGESDGDNDVINLSGAGDYRVVYNEYDSESGMIEFLDAHGAVTGSAEFEGVETIVPCFTPGTRINTARGDILVEDLMIGDLVKTRDHGMQPIRWLGHRVLSARELAQHSYLQPVKIARGALGNALPSRDMCVSPNHRVLITDPKTELLFGETEILVSAKHLIGMPGITRADVTDISYVHFMCDGHEIVLSDGIWSESFQPGAQALAGLDDAQRTEIFTLFPDLEHAPEAVFTAARPILRKHESVILRHL
ncbi:Hint domain-containing protein [Cognatishimia sp. SS12]|uniref:Hint domain-containing protein n=1 Tax=Cognatishimia sp. SS12 TaxID=2979465 RepID=UPI00232C2352|nr:Hint domain-containing protein [Cognatishimia sp. SS12]MDC0737045.1 Hint domain-containing protein [Cognatishimia sp. SS12]